MRGHQLALPVQLRDSASFETFYAGPNATAVDALRTASTDVLLYGAPGSGKSHLLQAFARSRDAAYLPLAPLASAGPEILAGYDGAAALCLDDLEAVSAERDWSLALLRLLDTLRARGACCCMAAATTPERLHVALPDLRTRLAGCAVFGLKLLSDDDRGELLRERAQARGLELGKDVSRWLLARIPRDTHTLLRVIDELDRASLAQQRRLTLPFTQQVTASLLQQTLSLDAADGRTTPG